MTDPDPGFPVRNAPLGGREWSELGALSAEHRAGVQPEPGGHAAEAVAANPRRAREAGGDHFHAGGKHWKTKSDPEWQILAGWVRGEKATGTSR